MLLFSPGQTGEIEWSDTLVRTDKLFPFTLRTFFARHGSPFTIFLQESPKCLLKMDEGSTVILTQVMNDSSFKILNRIPNLTGFPSWRCQKTKGQPGAIFCEPSTKQSGEDHLKFHLFFPTYVPLSGDGLYFQTASFYPVHFIQIRR